MLLVFFVLFRHCAVTDYGGILCERCMSTGISLSRPPPLPRTPLAGCPMSWNHSTPQWIDLTTSRRSSLWETITRAPRWGASRSARAARGEGLYDWLIYPGSVAAEASRIPVTAIVCALRPLRNRDRPRDLLGQR